MDEQIQGLTDQPTKKQSHTDRQICNTRSHLRSAVQRDEYIVISVPRHAAAATETVVPGCYGDGSRLVHRQERLPENICNERDSLRVCKCQPS